MRKTKSLQASFYVLLVHKSVFLWCHWRKKIKSHCETNSSTRQEINLVSVVGITGSIDTPPPPPPGWGANPSHSYPQQYVTITHLQTWVRRDNARKSFLSQSNENDTAIRDQPNLEPPTGRSVWPGNSATSSRLNRFLWMNFFCDHDRVTLLVDKALGI